MNRNRQLINLLIREVRIRLMRTMDDMAAIDAAAKQAVATYLKRNGKEITRILSGYKGNYAEYKDTINLIVDGIMKKREVN